MHPNLTTQDLIIIKFKCHIDSSLQLKKNILEVVILQCRFDVMSFIFLPQEVTEFTLCLEIHYSNLRCTEISTPPALIVAQLISTRSAPAQRRTADFRNRRLSRVALCCLTLERIMSEASFSFD